jgi:hypothetical protein
MGQECRKTFGKKDTAIMAQPEGERGKPLLLESELLGLAAQSLGQQDDTAPLKEIRPVEPAADPPAQPRPASSMASWS